MVEKVCGTKMFMGSKKDMINIKQKERNYKIAMGQE
jgi:hypothetical protein